MTMYGPRHIAEMARLKRELDPAGQLGRGNLLDEALLDLDEGAVVGAAVGEAAEKDAAATVGEAAPVGEAAEKGGERA